jgi:hypothetical protein
MGHISITFDTDHMSEASMTSFLSGLELKGAATFFCTKSYDCLSKQQNLHEVAIHPVLDNTTDWATTSNSLRQNCNPAKVLGARAHSMAYKQQYGVWLANNGFDYVSQATLYYQSGIQPYWHPWGLWEMPIYFQDNADLDMAKSVPEFKALNEAWLHRAIKAQGTYVFAFHPVHIMLNTYETDTYVKWRQSGNPDLSDFDRTNNKGIGSYFDRLLQLMRAAGIESAPLRDLTPETPSVTDWIGNSAGK